VDTPQEFTHVSLCAGYGGIDLGLKRAIPTLRTVAFSEIEAYACANLVAKMEAGQLDPAPIWTDLKTFPWAAFHGRVDILSGGYPCQPFSAAGKRLGTDDPRHLWPFIATGIRLMQPRFCFFENVEGHISLGLRAVIEELAELGYTATWGIFSASEVGAPHQRKRVFILAKRSELAHPGFGPGRAEPEQQQAQYAEVVQGSDQLAHRVCVRGRSGHAGREDAVDAVAGRTDGMLDAGGLSGPGVGLADPSSEGFQGYGRGQDGEKHAQSWASSPWPSRPGQPQHEWEPPRVVGNATVMQCDSSDDYSRISHSGESLPEPGDTGGATGMGDTADGDGASREKTGCQEINAGGSDWVRGSQAQPALGGDADGPAGGLDYGQLCIASDNRTDELRLLGNGVVPATAYLAFTTLCKELNP